LLLLGETPLDKLAFEVGQLGRKQRAIAINVIVMGTHSGQTFVHRHDYHPKTLKKAGLQNRTGKRDFRITEADRCTPEAGKLGSI
jgi:hypothetical protein